MEWASDIIFSYNETQGSPDMDGGGTFLKLSVSELEYEDGLLTFGVYLSAMIPTATALRYEDINEAFVFVLSDMDRGQCLSIRTFNSFIRFDTESKSPTNLLSSPPFPLLSDKSSNLGAFRGGWVSATLSLKTPFPKHAPNLFIHAALENNLSNVVGLDLLKKEAIFF